MGYNNNINNKLYSSIHIYIYIMGNCYKLIKLCITITVLTVFPFIVCIIIIEMLHKTLIFFCNFKQT